MSEDNWVEEELNNKKEIIADLRDRIAKEKEIQQQYKQAIAAE